MLFYNSDPKITICDIARHAISRREIPARLLCTCLEFGNEPTNHMSANMFGELMTKSRWVAVLTKFEKWAKIFQKSD